MHVVATYVNLHATSGQMAEKNACVVASRVQCWRPLNSKAASILQ